jgi:biopolymer transport protein ExbD
MAADEKLNAAQRSKIRRLSAPKEHAPDEAGGELNIIPFLDIVTNVLMFVLATITVTFTATIDTFPPRAGSGARAPTTPTLGLAVFVVPEGFSLKARGGNVAPGCNDAGPGITIGKRESNYDYLGLKQCAAKLKAASPDFKDEVGVTITASPQVPFQVIISTMDAVRNDEAGESMFPDVSFGVVK